LLSVTVRAVQEWVSDLDQAEREERKKVIQDLYLKAYSENEIASAIGTTRTPVQESLLNINEDVRKNSKVTFSESDYQPPIYNVWAFGKKTNETEHFGNTEQRIVDNLLWLYTQPLDIVVDPFGGGGSTLDVCKVRGRRCWISDRKPKPGMEDKLRTMDVCEELPSLNKRWSDVSLVYLDPPYWKQAENEYSSDAADLANMTLDEFTKKMVGVVRRFGEKMRDGSVIALIIQPTQWRAEPKGSFADHVFDIMQGVSKCSKLTVENRISCPYSSEQCTPQMVEWSKENKKPLVLSRELVVWRVAS
jgi:DNA modification methylase